MNGVPESVPRRSCSLAFGHVGQDTLGAANGSRGHETWRSRHVDARGCGAREEGPAERDRGVDIIEASPGSRRGGISASLHTGLRIRRVIADLGPAE